MAQTQVEACLAKAQECERRAMVADGEQIKLIYLEFAGQWRAIARLIEDLDGSDDSVSTRLS